MKNNIGLIAVISALLLTGAGCGSSATNQSVTNNTPVPTNPTPTVTTPQQPTVKTNEPSSVTIQNFSFNPVTLNVKKGTTVTWTNNDSVPHQIKSDTFNSDVLSNGQNYSFTFNAAGTFDYSCAIHPSMTGKIIVE